MPMNRADYPDDWEQISLRLRFGRAKGRCEGSPQHPDCRAEHGKRHPDTGSYVVLTVAHLGVDKPDGTPGDKHDKMDCREENLRVMCQRCHLAYDRPDHIRKAAINRRQKRIDAGQMELSLD